MRIDLPENESKDTKVDRESLTAARPAQHLIRLVARQSRCFKLQRSALYQPDNAARVERLGISRTLARNVYNRETAARELNNLLSDAKYSEKAREVGLQVQNENGAVEACNAMESLLHATVR